MIFGVISGQKRVISAGQVYDLRGNVSRSEKHRMTVRKDFSAHPSQGIPLDVINPKTVIGKFLLFRSSIEQHNFDKGVIFEYNKITTIRRGTLYIEKNLAEV